MKSEKAAKSARINALKMVHNANASHIASALSIIDILAVLYEDILNISSSDFEHIDRDRFILSKGHACVAVYSILAEFGFFPKELLLEYGKNESILMHHISHKVPGVEFSTGSLGHGLPFGVGKALTAKLKKKDWRTYLLLGDGEMQEGSNWEALMFAAHHKLGNLLLIIDYNNQQSLTSVDDTLSLQPLDKKLSSFGWNVLIADGHDHKDLKKCMDAAKKIKSKPSVIIAKTTKGKGVSFMEDSVQWHYKPPNSKELAEAISEIKNA